jgi:DNA-binding transcriptional LysR family regulator
LWEDLLLPCLPRIRKAIGDVAVRAEIGFEDELMQGLVEARTDIGVMYTPQRRPGLLVEPLFEEQLVYVSSTLDTARLPGDGYVYVEWGPEFASQHSAAFPEFDGASFSTNIGWLGLQQIIAYGGAGYFPQRMVRQELLAGRLHRRPDAPEFVLPAYLVHLAEPNPDTVGLAVQIIREAIAAMSSDP